MKDLISTSVSYDQWTNIARTIAMLGFKNDPTYREDAPFPKNAKELFLWAAFYCEDESLRDVFRTLDLSRASDLDPYAMAVIRKAVLHQRGHKSIYEAVELEYLPTFWSDPYSLLEQAGEDDGDEGGIRTHEIGKAA